MDKNPVQPEGAKAPAKKEDPLATAKQQFAEAVAKTKEQEGQAPVSEEPKPKKVAAKAEAKPEPDKSAAEFAALRAEMAEMRKQLQPKPDPKPEKKVSDFEDVEAELSEQFGEDEGKILTGALRKLLEPREQRIAQMESLIQKAVEQSKAVSAKSNKARLAKEYDLSDDAWEIVQLTAEKRVAEGKFSTADEAYESVVKALYPGKSAKEQEEEAEELASRIAASTPTQPNTARRERKMTKTDAMRQVFNHLIKNPDDVTGAKRLSQELRVDKE